MRPTWMLEDRITQGAVIEMPVREANALVRAAHNLGRVAINKRSARF